MGVAFTVMWQLYADNALQYNFLVLLFMVSCILFRANLFLVYPMSLWATKMSNDFHERTNIMAVAQWIGQWAWVIAPWFWVIMDDPDWFLISRACDP